MAAKPTEAKLPATQSIARLELCIVSSSRVRCGLERSFDGLQPARENFRIVGGGFAGFLAILLDGKLGQMELFLDLQVGAKGFLGIGVAHRSGRGVRLGLSDAGAERDRISKQRQQPCRQSETGGKAQYAECGKTTGPQTPDATLCSAHCRIER